LARKDELDVAVQGKSVSLLRIKPQASRPSDLFLSAKQPWFPLLSNLK